MKINSSIFLLCHNSKAKNIQPVASEWYHSEPVQRYIQELEQLARMKIGRIIDSSGESSGNLFAGNLTDFTDIGQFIGFLNNKANSIQDENQRQKYLSMLSDLLRFKEGGKGPDSDVQRFYTPLTCRDCQLYINQRDNQQE